MKKYILGFILLIVGLSANAGQNKNEIKLPHGYQKEYVNSIKKQAYFIDQEEVRGNPSVIFTFVSDTTKNDMWFTTCQHSLDKGLPVFTCFTQQGQFGIDITSSGYNVIFRFEKPKEILSTQINYKIDNNKIMTLPVSAITSGIAAETFIRQLKEASVLNFSWKEGSQYKAEKINLNGLAESLFFAQKMIEVNN
ncbi:hypothetical protein [Acinetobacter equi]|uniref:Uncharacterized protein n=1 Tax=Acinetobacter equi TaxID=1324350 RepID=A0A0N9V8Z0_9GAMM|nr:hypothetical protein [Acinetobacter equi]ALH95673.1 hypothetical protein AOY20_09095 [Acinetobacter equi]